eukprot:14967671-Alexandrium_andersonii.AAC.1
MVRAPGADDPVANQSDKRCQIRGGGGRHSPAALLSNEPQVRAIHAKVLYPGCQRPETQACSKAERLGCLFRRYIPPVAR